MPSDANPPKGQPFRTTLKRIWDALHRHPLTKLAALLLAVAFWAIVIASDPTLTIEKSLPATAVTVQGTDALRNRGYVVMNDLTSEPVTVKMKVEVKRADYDTVTAESFSPRLDLSQITQAGSQEVKFTAGYTYLGEVLSFEPESITLNVDEYTPPTRVPVVVEQTGDEPEDLWTNTPTADPRYVYVSGPKSLVSRVTRVVAELPYADLTAERASDGLALPIELRDANDRPVSSKLVSVTNESVDVETVTVSVNVFSKRRVPISYETAVTGVPAHGYALENVVLYPEEVEVAAARDVLDELESLHVASPLDISGLTAGQNVPAGLRGLGSLEYAAVTEVTLRVDIVPAIHTHTYLGQPVTVMGLPAGLQAELDHGEMNVVIVGEYENVEGLKAEDIHLYVDATGLKAGTHTLTVYCRTDGTDAFEYEAEVPEVLLTLSPAE